ncbi:hypothetical protein C9J85_10690 [Haloferax sp. wsp5]|nr:hypothetical protein C9J85_10690 [Haloferax sp. wsp5]
MSVLQLPVPRRAGRRVQLSRTTIGIIVGSALALGTWLLLNRTRFGMIIRAGSEDREMAGRLPRLPGLLEPCTIGEPAVGYLERDNRTSRNID